MKRRKGFTIIEVVLVLAIAGLIFAMVFWSYIIVIKTPAGSIPLYWGFYIGDDDEKRKRYCLI